MIPIKIFDYDKIVQGTKLLLEGLDLDIKDQHLIKTPSRVAKAWTETLARGYLEDPGQIIISARFEDPSYSEIVLLKSSIA